MSNPYTNTRIEYHILQSFPVTCLNRDDVGAPKTAVIGGVTRARVSSQCWKRAVRLALQYMAGITLGIRTKKVKQLVVDACLQVKPTEDEQLLKNIDQLAEHVSKILDDKSALDKSTGEFKTSTLVFLSSSDAKRVAEAMQAFDFSLGKLKDEIGVLENARKDAKKAKNKEEEDRLKLEVQNLKNIESVDKFLVDFDAVHDGLDIALFGRMVANAASMNVEAAASFAHAISTHRVSNEVEFFTALDDQEEGPGSAHMGSLEFNSATYYRYISLDIGQLAKNLGLTEADDSEDLKKAIAAFTQALFVAVPSARQTTMSGANDWDFARVLIRKGQRLQASFEKPVKSIKKSDEEVSYSGFSEPSVQELKAYLDKKEKLSGSLFGKLAAYDWGEDENFSIDDLIAALQSHVQ